MEVASMASHSFLINARMLSTPTKSRPTNSTRSTNSSCGSCQPIFFLLSSAAVCRANSAASKSEPNLSLQHPILVPREALSLSYFLPDSTLRAALLFHIFGHTFFKRKCLEQPPPDLASYLYKNCIVYLRMSLVPLVTELILAEFLYLQYEDEENPIYLYINSTGTTKGGEKLGYETEAFAIYDVMRLYSVDFPYFAFLVWEAALLLAAGAKGNCAALPSSTIMIKQPIARFQGQATVVHLARKEVKNVKAELVKLYSRHMGKSPEQIEADIRHPKYFSPSEAVEYGIIDKVLYTERSSEDRGVVSELKKAQLI
ncbi:ATP-dependent Clp protease proteolytic subunit-protein 4, chloroplastic, variant 2 [Ancistrocladus abbreviatus]